VKLHRFILALSPLFLSSLVLAAETRSGYFFQQRALDPVKLQTGLPEPAGRLHGDQKSNGRDNNLKNSELQISLLHNNVFMGGRADNERLILDGESTQLNVRFSRRINACWQINAATAYLAHSSGWFDQPVNDWHQLFGLPDAQRGDWPNNLLQYAYEKNGEIHALPGEASGFGDMQLQLQRSLGCQEHSTLFRLGAKLPLGEPENFFGSGSIDVFVDAQLPWRAFRPNSRWQWSGSAGLLFAGKNDLLAKQNPVSAFGVFGVNAQITSKLSFVGQMDWHSPMFDSQLRELGKLGNQLSLGLRYNGALGNYELSFSEDVAVDTSPDIVVRLAWISRFGAR